MYKINLTSSHEHNPVTEIGKPGTVSLPAACLSIVIRISNPQALVNHETRVENEVAAMVLMRDCASLIQLPAHPGGL